MGVKTIETRIENKFDTLANWAQANVKLLPGEIAFVQVTDQQIDETTGKIVDVPALLMKVGNGTDAFNELPWLSAKAADVYAWAKSENAADISVTVGNAGTNTLGSWLQSLLNTTQTTDATLATKADSTVLDAKVAELQNAIKSSIEALDHIDSGSSGAFVTNVTQADGKVTVTKGNIAVANIPELSTDKITGLTDKLATYGASIEALQNKKEGHTDTEINTLITNKLSSLSCTDPTSSGSSYDFITSISQTDGKISATKATLPTADATTLGVVSLGADGGAATYASVSGIDGRLGVVEGDLETLKSAIAGGIHFVGLTQSTQGDLSLTTNNTTSKIAIVGNNYYLASKGDLVIQGDKEFIWTGSKWEELGNVSRIGELEETITNMAVADTASQNQFVTSVSQTAGKITVSRAQPTAANISYSSGSVADALANLEGKVGANNVSTTITNFLADLDYTSPTAVTTTATQFIDTVTQTDGKISATKKTLPSASTNVAGIVKLGATGGAATYDRVEELAASIPDATAFTSYLYNNASGQLAMGSNEVIFDCGTSTTSIS